jgi:hypothetical protein
VQNEMISVTKQDSLSRRAEFVIAAFALIALLLGQWWLSIAIHGATAYGLDGKMVVSVSIAAFKYGGWFQLTNISPIEGVGSQMLPMNVWANPSLWPFAVFDKEMATDVSTMVALGIFMTCCYIMARCFDLPVVPSAIGAQLCVLLFAPAVLISLMPPTFCSTLSNAVAFASQFVAFGLLARLEPGSRCRIVLVTAGIFATLFYSFYVDPLWASINVFGWAVAFAVVTLSPFRIKTILLRAGVLAFCGALFIITGVAGYLVTISQYTTRVQYPALVDRPRSFELVSALAESSNMQTFYLACAIGSLLGLLLLRGRPRVLAAAAVASLVAWFVYSTVYLLLLDSVWVPPIPRYIELSLWVLYVTGALAGYWGVLQFVTQQMLRVAGVVQKRYTGAQPSESVSDRLFGFAGLQSQPARGISIVIASIILAVVPAKAIDYALNHSSAYAEAYHLPWPKEPGLMKFLSENVSSQVGQTLRGSIANQVGDSYTSLNLWAAGMHTIDEYSQLVTPQAIYFIHMALKQNVTGTLNRFFPSGGSSWESFINVMQLLGARYYLSIAKVGDIPPLLVLPRETPVPKGAGWSTESGEWYIYEWPHPNVGNYSPTDVVTAQSAAQMMEKFNAPDFDPGRSVVLSTSLDETLAPAHDMRLSRIRGGFHISGRSEGTSLIVLPLQYSHCLQAADPAVRFVRADLLLTGMIFTHVVDTDITFGYGIFSPGCRRADLTDFKQLDMKIDLRMPHLKSGRTFVDWDGAVARFHEVGLALGLWTPPPPAAAPAPAS